MKDLEKKLEELNQKYRELLREGKTAEATDIVQKSRRLKRKNRDDNSKKSEPKQEDTTPKKEQFKDSKPKQGNPEEFEQVKGAGSELAIELSEEFSSVKELAKANTEQLISIPGIGKKKAKSLLKEANKIKEGE